MLALLWKGVREIEIEEFAEPAPGPGEVLVAVGHVGICGSELEGYLGLSSLRTPPLIMGHEFWGTVVKVGAGVDPGWTGRSAAINPMVGCGECALCHHGSPHLCRRRVLVGVHRPGGFAERVAVPTSALVPVSSRLQGPLGALAEPTAVALHATRLAGVRLGDTVAVIGTGTIGLLVTRLASAAGARVVAVDTHPERLELAQAQGARHRLQPRGDDVAGQMSRIAGDDGIRVVVDAVGRSATRALAMRVVRPGGVVALVGIHDAETPVPGNDLVRWEVAVRGSFTYTPADFRDAVELLEDGVVSASGWVQVEPLAGGPAAFRRLVDAPPREPKVVLAAG